MAKSILGSLQVELKKVHNNLAQKQKVTEAPEAQRRRLEFSYFVNVEVPNARIFNTTLKAKNTLKHEQFCKPFQSSRSLKTLPRQPDISASPLLSTRR